MNIRYQPVLELNEAYIKYYIALWLPCGWPDVETRPAPPHTPPKGDP